VLSSRITTHDNSSSHTPYCFGLVILNITLQLRLFKDIYKFPVLSNSGGIFLQYQSLLHFYFNDGIIFSLKRKMSNEIVLLKIREKKQDSEREIVHNF